MSGFDADWLAQREPFDLAARSHPLEQSFARALTSVRSNQPLRLADLGGGTAANFRALAPRLAGDQQWLLLDHDAQLLSDAPRRIAQWATDQGWQAAVHDHRCEVLAGSARWTLATRQIDLAASLESIEAVQFDGIVTTAFLDLVSLTWLERFARWLVESRRPLLATLTVDGVRRWQPEIEGDALIDAAFRRHQGGDKGFGESVGPGAADALAQCFRALACPVWTEQSNWQIGPREAAMLGRMADEAVQVALEVSPAERLQIEAWRARRGAQIGQHEASLVIGHLDLLAVPESTAEH